MIEHYHDDQVGINAGESVRRITLDSASKNELEERLGRLRVEMHGIETQKSKWGRYLTTSQIELFESRGETKANQLPQDVTQAQVDSENKKWGNEWRRVIGKIHEVEAVLKKFPEPPRERRTEDM
jgi:hypothetical protein